MPDALRKVNLKSEEMKEDHMVCHQVISPMTQNLNVEKLEGA